MAIAAERSMSKMHWRWRRRGQDILSLLLSRFGSALPDDDAGLDAAKLLGQHYMQLHVDAERVTKANLRLWADWLTDKAIAGIIKGAKKAKTPSAVRLGKEWRVTADEVATNSLETIRAYTVTQETDRSRQARRRRNAGATTKRGRPKSEGLPAWKAAGASSKAAYYRNRKKASETEIRHAPSYIRGMQRDELKSHEFESHIIVDRRAQQARRRETEIVLDGEIIEPGGSAWAAPPSLTRGDIDVMKALQHAAYLQSIGR
jgi:hypothetical protein